MAKSYNDKIHSLVNQRHRHNDRHHEGSYTHCPSNNKKYTRRDHNDHHGHNHHYKYDDRDCKSLPECDDKAFKPCHLHGPKSQHTFKKCFKIPKNQDKKSYSYDKKGTYKAHHNNKRHASKDKESRSSVDLSAPSNSHLEKEREILKTSPRR